MHVLAETRRIEIESRIQRGMPVNASVLAEEFQVTEDAIRRDLRKLAAEGKCKRVYGGALPMSPQGGSIEHRLRNAPQEKRFKRTLIASSERVAALITLDKIETRAPFQVTALGSVDHVVLECNTSEEIVSAFSSAGPAVILAKP
jgi:DeoR/GlpR family transcriptional regulator of sugar metabolism